MLTKRETLRAMGIEVWSLRSGMTPANLDLANSDAASAKPSTPSSKKPSASSLTPIEALKAQVAPTGEDSVEAAQGQRRSTGVENSADQAADQTAHPSGDKSVPSFRYAMLHYDSVGVCISLPQESEVPRRLCDDLARLMGGDIKAVKFQELKWPMLSNSGIDQSLGAARQVVTEKFRLLPQKVIVIGADVGHCFQPVQDLAHMTHGRFGAQAYFLIDSADALISSSETKRRLMMALLAWR